MKRLVFLLLIGLMCFQLDAQDKKRSVTLYWDTSYGMREKNLDIELNFLDSYFSNTTNCEVELIKFSNDIILSEKYNVINGNWLKLKKELLKTIYDGSSYFSLIKETNTDEILLFTDGNETNDQLPTAFVKPVKVISSSSKLNEPRLKRLANLSRGEFINLLNKTSLNDLNDKFITISGVVNDVNGPLENVAVSLRNSNVKHLTNKKGEYSLKAQIGSILEFNYVGKKKQIVKVPASGKKDVIMYEGSEVLNEVNVVANEVELVDTGNTKVDKKRLGYAVESIDSDDISQLDTDVQQAVSGQFSNLTLPNDSAIDDIDLSQFIGRGKNMSVALSQYGLIVLDGVPLGQSDSSGRSGPTSLYRTNHINPDNIASITYLKGLAATNKYGTLGRNGVLLITTKTAAGSSSSKKKDIVLGNTPTYTGDAISMNSIGDKPYIKALQQSTTIENAYEEYLKQRKTYGNSVAFFTDVATYFNGWGNKIMLDRIISNIAEFSTNKKPNILLVQAYKYEELGLYTSALNTYKRIFELFPEQIQSDRNLAISYVNNQLIKEAQGLYQSIDANFKNGRKQYGILKKSINNEYKNLVALKNKDLNNSIIDPLYKENIFYDTRIVFEWNEFDAEFDLQIVNPQNRFFTWSHTKNAEPSRFDKEQQRGFGLEEFFLTKKDKGEWLFNLKYLGKVHGDNSYPTYLKITTYKNFGKQKQTRTTKVLTLEELNKNETVLKIKI